MAYVALLDLHHLTCCVLTSATPVWFAHSATVVSGKCQIHSCCRSFLVAVASLGKGKQVSKYIHSLLLHFIAYSVTYFLTTLLKIFIPLPLVHIFCLPALPCHFPPSYFLSYFPVIFSVITVFHIMYFTYSLV